MIQPEVNLLLQRNGKNTSLVRNLANEKDKQAFYFKFEISTRSILLKETFWFIFSIN